MRLIFSDPLRPRDRFVINERTDSKNPLVNEGETFEVPDAYGRLLLAHYHPRIDMAPEPKKQSEKPEPAKARAASADAKEEAEEKAKRAAE